MSRTVTLTLLRDDIRFQADLIGATVRHTDAQLTRLVNQSIQEFREAISNEGNTHYLVAYSGTLTVGATSPYSFLSLDLSGISPSIVRTYKFEITVDNVVHKLNHRPFNDDNVWGGPASTGIPQEWSHYQTAKLAIHPPPESAYAYTLWYLPVFTDLSADGDTFDGVSGWEAWTVWDVVCRLLIRDQQGSAFGSAKLYRDDVWSRIQRNATKVSHAGGAVVGRDTLRGRIPDFLAARQAVMAGGGPPASGSVTLDMMADMTGPAVLGRVAGTGRPTVVGGSAVAQSILPVFGPTWQGVVPAAGGSSTSKFLSQAGTFETVAGGGGGGGSPGGPTGSIQFAGLSGFVGYTGFAVQGQPPSMTVRLPGSLRVTGGTVDVGSGTVRMSGSGIDLGGNALLNVATLIAFPTFAAGVPGLVPSSDNGVTSFLRADGQFAMPTGFFSVPTGLPNAHLAAMPSGTVKANLTGTGVPADVLIPTLMAFFPTFTAGRVGLVPGTADGDTGKFLNAAGAFSTPVAAATPGGVSGNIQYNNAGAMGGGSGIHAVAGGAAFAIGPAALVAGDGDMRVGSGFSLRARNPSGISQPLVEFWNPTGTVSFGGSGLPRIENAVASGGVQSFTFGGATSTTARLLPTGFDLSSFHITAKSIDVEHINGLPANQNNLKRGANIFLASGLSLYLPRISPTGANRYIVPSGAVGTNMSVILQPSGGKGGNVIRIERVDSSAGQIDVKTPTGTILYSMPSGTKHWADFMFSKPSGTAFEHAGSADMF